MSAEDRELVALFEGLDTPGVSDAMDKLGLPGQCLGIVALDVVDDDYIALSDVIDEVSDAAGWRATAARTVPSGATS